MLIKRRKRRWLAVAAILYGLTTSGGIGTAVWSDLQAKKEAVKETIKEVVKEEVREIIAPDPIPPCPTTEKAIEVPPEKQAGTVNVGELNVRAKPAGAVMAQVHKGDQLEILDRKTVSGMEWLRISKGWVAARYIDVNAVPEVVPSAPVICPFPPAMCPAGTVSIFKQ